ncbi:hypothetical protein [Candidatus Neomicrothrix sp.]|jgi:hypothetical protein|uniref:Uncharacterized protein n=1 Tax=Candidatus Neomicrothrix subdominans TaxID=2954438 RepID=A0A936TD27_9ACTN|nr:hypothetical protein [Candidatus Microthrix sp.]MBK9295632.1 hypothetical protein [Candidatus Microthrix subdominans]MBK6310522.1 hypothetical protein [Candidatus Microthrix sp.]MBK6438420.1 hypothetical protein [Candidatus Microthrix sp.]MBK6970689.1 hypothetical protein [Candidatus Microthrix sp.]MBK7165671.1 hypothetical protein [Candidatus Microthrix sp.]
MSEPTDRPWLERDRRPSGVSDETVSAVGKFSEALEWVERARGHLYDFHQMMGHADALIGEAADELREAGHQDQAQRIEAELVGRNALEGRWSFQMVEEYDAIYWSVVRAFADDLRGELMGGRHHVLESEMKEDRRTHGGRFHEQRPTDVPN